VLSKPKSDIPSFYKNKFRSDKTITRHQNSNTEKNTDKYLREVVCVTKRLQERMITSEKASKLDWTRLRATDSSINQYTTPRNTRGVQRKSVALVLDSISL